MEMSELKNRAVSFDTAELKEVYVGDSTIPEKNFRAVMNIDKKAVATMVSDRYNLVQHQHVVNSAIDAITGLNINSTAEVNDAGNRLFVDISFTDSRLYVENVGEEFVAGVRLVNSYDRTTGIMVIPHLKRLACSNGMVVSVGWVKGYHIKHSQKLADDFASTIEVMLKDMINNNEKLKAMVNDCIGDSIEWETMHKILAKLVTGRKKHIDKIKEILIRDCKNQIPTRWDLYNAFTSYATHGQQLRPNIEQWLQNKAQKLLVTPLQELRPIEVSR